MRQFFRETPALFVPILPFVILLLSAATCQSPLTRDPPEVADKITYHTLGDANLHAQMQEMAIEIRALIDVYYEHDLEESARQDRALASLSRIQNIADDLGGENKITNYSVINEYMGAFLYDVEIARGFILQNPPNYFPAGTLIKSCLSCHQSI